jgi:hypothetical protein
MADPASRRGFAAGPWASWARRGGVFLICALALGYGLWVFRGPGPAATAPSAPANPGAPPSTPETTVVLRRGAGLNEIASTLDKAA